MKAQRASCACTVVNGCAKESRFIAQKPRDAEEFLGHARLSLARLPSE
jgi:hypothetical protein